MNEQRIATPQLAAELDRSDARWASIGDTELDTWNTTLLQTDAHLFQYPFWNQPFRSMHFTPRALIWKTADGLPLAYVCILTLITPLGPIGLVQRGPVSLVPGQPVPGLAVHALSQWSKRRQYLFLRFTSAQPELLQSIAAIAGGVRGEPFPFYRDLRDELVVEQSGEDQTLAGFQAVARRKIEKARRVGYELAWSDSPESLAQAWPLFTSLAQRKGFQFRPLSSFLDLVGRARQHGCARLYTASLDGRLIEAILTVRDAATAYYISGALDTAALGEHPSPSCLLHWRAMRDYYELGARRYHLGTRSGVVYQFKRQFRPVETDCPAPLVLAGHPIRYRLWSSLVLKWGMSLWPSVRRMVFRERSR